MSRAAEPGDPVVQAAPPPTVDELGDWADAVSDATGVPERVLFAYGAADPQQHDRRLGSGDRVPARCAFPAVDHLSAPTW